MIVIKNDILKAEIDDLGAQLCSLVDLRCNRELLWTGTPPFWKYHAPVLFPFVGTVNEGQYRFRGRTYTMGQHGFARQKGFHLVSQTDNSVVYKLESDDQTRGVYPFDFCFTVTQTLVDNHLVVNWKVYNPSQEEELFFSIGAHPAFRVPLEETSRKNECYVYFPDYTGEEKLNYIIKDPDGNGAEAGKTYHLDLVEGFLKLEDHLFDIDTFIFENGQVEEVSLCGPDRKPYVTVRCTGFPYFGLWTQSDEAPFVCLEPWYGRLDDKGFTGELSEKTGIRKLKPGESFETSYEIIVL